MTKSDEAFKRGLDQLVELCEFADAVLSWNFDEIQLAIDYAHTKPTPGEVWATNLVLTEARKFALAIRPADEVMGSKMQ